MNRADPDREVESEAGVKAVTWLEAQRALSMAEVNFMIIRSFLYD